MAILSAIVCEWELFLRRVTFPIVENCGMLLVFLVGKRNVVGVAQGLNLADENHMVAAGVLCHDTSVNKCQGVVNNWGACRGGVEAGVTEVLVAFFGGCSEAARKMLLFVGEYIDGKNATFANAGQRRAFQIDARQHQEGFK